MKKRLFIEACLVALASTPVLAQTTGPQVAVVTSYSNGFAAGHFVVDKDGKTEVIDFPGNTLEKAQRERVETLRLIVAKLYQEGYALKAGASSGELIFVKEK
jgi:hypothetical protein